VRRRCAHCPQSGVSVCVSAEWPPPQFVCPAAHPAHSPLAHVCPAPQLAFVVHATQRLAVASQ
jgi:hypothetical protein